MVKNLPRLLLASDLSLNQQGTGANRTLFNLFESYPPELLMLCCPNIYIESEPTSPPFERNSLSLNVQYLPLIPNRIGRLINPVLTNINLQLIDWLPVSNRKSLDSFAPEVILICPITPWGLLMGQKLIQYFQCPFLIYFMDDWIEIEHWQWLSGSVKETIYQLLKQSAGWLMISEQLKEAFSSRYQLLPKQYMIVHNPVDLSGKQLPDVKTPHEGSFKVVYAGAIWAMHYDALAAVAEAIFQLRQDGKDIELVLHTDQSFWDFYKNKWQLWQVTYGSLIPYCELDRYLKCADLLLVPSSFLPEYSLMTRSSVQTKLTDYMASGRPILCCGPDYSACNHFIKKWNCGIVCETNRVSEIKENLIEQMKNTNTNLRFAKTAFEVLKNNFEKSLVSINLYNFIKNISKYDNS